MKFTGHERDLADPTSPADDLDYMHSRFANPITGRFLTLDSLVGEKDSPQAANRYSYVMNNPLTTFDRLGLAGCATDDCITVTTTAPNDTSAIASFNSFLAGLLNVGQAQWYYSGNVAKYAGQGDDFLAFINYSAGKLVPSSKLDLSTTLGLALIPGDFLIEKAGVEITVFSKHALNQMIGRDGVGVATKAILDAVRNPIKVVLQTEDTLRIVGKDAVVVLNDEGRVITAWATNSAGWRILP
jgi:RHS repeat-associated protein